MKPVRVTVIAYAPTVFRHCQHCELAFDEMGVGERIRREEARTALPDDLAEEYAHVSDWIHGLIERHGSRIAIDLVDAASIEGFIRSARHRIRRYPAVIVDGEARRAATTGYDELDRIVAERVEQRDRMTAAGGAA